MTIPVVDAQPYADTIKAALTAQGIAHAEGRKPTVGAGLPYIVWWLNSGAITDRSLRSRDGFNLTLSIQSYGFNPDSKRFAVRRGRAAVASLPGVAVGGRVLLVPELAEGSGEQRDDDADPPLWWETDVWRLPTSPA